MNEKGFVYIIHAVGTNRVKIGYSLEPERRLADLQTSSPFPLVLIGSRDGTPDLEQILHQHLSEYRCVGEWFEIDPQDALDTLINFDAEDIEINESVATALMHLEMIFQAVAGDHSAKRNELEKRKAALTAFMVSGQCVADDSDRALAAKVNEVVSSHFSMVNDTAA
jgi:hypothetical protein